MVKTTEESAVSVRWRRIASHYRELIESGKLKVGAKLPSTKELAKQFETSVYSVQYALASLTHEGLIVRRQRHGTIVNDPVPKLKLAAILIFVDGRVGINNYIRTLTMAITEELRRRNCESITLLENTDAPDIVARLKRMIRTLGIQAIIHFASKPEVSEMLKQINIPVITNDTAVTSSHLVHRGNDFVEQALLALSRQGCRKPGIITFVHHLANGRDSALSQDFFARLERNAEKLGLDLPWSRICAYPDAHPHTGAELSEFAYKSFLKLWSQEEKPDGLIVYPDDLLQGLTQALAELRVKVPEELKLALHRNKEIDFFVPYPYTAVEACIQDQAKDFADALLATFGGQRIQCRDIQYQIVRKERMQ